MRIISHLERLDEHINILLPLKDFSFTRCENVTCPSFGLTRYLKASRQQQHPNGTRFAKLKELNLSKGRDPFSCFFLHQPFWPQCNIFSIMATSFDSSAKWIFEKKKKRKNCLFVLPKRKTWEKKTLQQTFSFFSLFLTL